MGVRREKGWRGGRGGEEERREERGERREERGERREERGERREGEEGRGGRRKEEGGRRRREEGRGGKGRCKTLEIQREGNPKKKIQHTFVPNSPKNLKIWSRASGKDHPTRFG
jgi:hypothetical protein